MPPNTLRGKTAIRLIQGSPLSDEEEGVPHLVDLPRLLDYADRAERDVASREELDMLLKGGSSLGGARPKPM
jgi:serine/threonine-protein kinase HipA